MFSESAMLGASVLGDDIWFLFAALFGMGLVFNPMLKRVEDPAARRRARRGSSVLNGAGVLMCLSFGILTRVAGWDVVESAWSGDLSHPLARVALGIWLFVVCAVLGYVFLLGGDADMAAMSARQRYGLKLTTPRGVRLFVAAVLFLFAVATILRVCLS